MGGREVGEGSQVTSKLKMTGRIQRALAGRCRERELSVSVIQFGVILSQESLRITCSLEVPDGAMVFSISRQCSPRKVCDGMNVETVLS